MQNIIFPGNDKQPCLATYGIFLEDGLAVRNAHIVVVQAYKDGGSSLINNEECRDALLNRILSQELTGVRVEFVRFSVIYVASNKAGFGFPIRLNLADYIKRGNPHDEAQIPASDLSSAFLNLLGKGDKQVTVLSTDVVGGCAQFFTDFDDRSILSGAEIDRLLGAIGYQE